MDITADEMMVVCMARQVRDGEIVVQGLATPLVAAAYLLARRTHAPNLLFASAIGQSLTRTPAPLGLTRVENLWLDRALIVSSFARIAVEYLPRFRPKEFFRPGQVDPAGNFNNIAFGKDYRRPRLRLPGVGGIPDVTVYGDEIYLYVPRHARVTFASQLDFISGLGHHPLRRRGSGPCYLVSNLGQFDFQGERDGRSWMRLTSFHPGVQVADIRAHTGFDFEVAPDLRETPLPQADELRVLREEIDPLGIRSLESMSGGERRRLLHQIVALEAAQPANALERSDWRA